MQRTWNNCNHEYERVSYFKTFNILFVNSKQFCQFFKGNNKIIFFRIVDDIFITTIFENTFAKWISLIFSISVTFISTPILYLVVLFEKDNQFRILMNQLVSSIAILGILFNILVQMQIIFLYIIGPLPEFLCYINLVLQGGFTIQFLLLMNFVIVVRYIFTFHLKNPTATHHDFWMLFLSIWSFGFGFISQNVFAFLPGKNPAHYYVCVGKISSILNNDEHHKFDVILTFVILLTVGTHIILGSRLKAFELKASKTTLTTHVMKHESNKNVIVTASFQLLTIALFILIFIPAAKAALVSFSHFNEYPNYFWMYFYHLYGLECFRILSLTVLLVRNPQLKSFVKRELLEKLGLNHWN